MSDVEDERVYDDAQEDRMEDVEENEQEADVPEERSNGISRRRREDDDDEEDDEEEEDEEEDEGDARGKKRRRRRKRPDVNRFLDLQAEVDDDEDEDEDEDYGKDDFLEEPGLEADDDIEDINRRAADHARLDRRERELGDQDLARVAQELAQRYKPTSQKYIGDMNEIPQRLLMPSVDDANLWQVRVKPGKERDLVFALMRKSMDMEFGAFPLEILSVFQRDSLPGMIYIEARSSKQVATACNGLVGIYISRGITLVPIEEMASLLQIKKKDTTVTPGSWVRIKRGKYAGDLAQVMDTTENGEEVGLKFVPRIDLSPKDEITSADGKKRKKTGIVSSINSRPPQRFFNYEEVVKAHGRRAVTKRNQVYVFANDTFRDGYIEKDIKLSGLILENVNPTLDEIMRFTRQEDGAENDQSVDLSIIAEASKKEAITVLQPGDHVEVFEGEQTGVHGVVESIANEVVTLRAIGVDIDGQKVDVPARSVRKRFKPGDHVKVMSGQNADETGLVVSIADNVVTFLSDMSLQEVSVFSKDLREAAEVGSSTNIVGNYELHDLVQLDMQTVGVIFKTERDSFRVLDQNGQVRLVHPHQISMQRDSTRAIATDAEGHELRVGDNVKEIDGEQRKGQVLHIHQSFFAFLHNREIVQNGGVFVTRARSLTSIAPKGGVVKAGSPDLSKMNPAMGGMPNGGTVGSQIGRGPRDRSIGMAVVVIKGPQKGYVGTIKDRNGNIVRVELLTGNKIIMIDQSKLHHRRPDGTTTPLDMALRQKSTMGPPSGRGGGFGGRTPMPNGSQTPAWGAGRTPNPYASNDGRTPNYSRTPNPYADGSKTPAWGSSRTPNPYTVTEGSRTPNPYANADGGRTPAWNANSSRTPLHRSGASDTWGASTTNGNNWGGSGTWGSDGNDGSGSWSVSESETPAPYNSAPTPAVSQPTPGMYQDDRSYPRTPGGIYGNSGTESTPAAALTPYSAPTPYPSYENYNGEEKFELKADWLIDPRFKELPDKSAKYFVVRIRGTRDELPMWNEGSRENTEGIVVSILETSQSYIKTAYIKILPGLQEELVVPIKYLIPVPPGQGDKAVVLSGDTLRDSVYTVTSMIGDTCVLATAALTETVHIDEVVKWQEW